MISHNRRQPNLQQSLALVIFLPQPAANAAVGNYTPYAHGVWGDPTGFAGNWIRIAWTSGYPGGVVRVESSSTQYYAIQLLVCASSGTTCTTWTQAAYQNLAPDGFAHKGYTPSVSVGKYSWYKACAKTAVGGNWLCWSAGQDVNGKYTAAAWPIYLGT